ncbi:hypothetical protein [Alcaligenes faecalis]|uniref:hypothetical protein n=1 Tax=Alcaligenes aquatilis TaxID=323284 RepID=UPI002AA93C65|nr:hypothetical protein [Alcaligenes faecalis]
MNTPSFNLFPGQPSMFLTIDRLRYLRLHGFMLTYCGDKAIQTALNDLKSSSKMSKSEAYEMATLIESTLFDLNAIKPVSAVNAVKTALNNGTAKFHGARQTRFDTHALAKVGFTIIRGLLDGRIPGGSAPAVDLADALHNLPEPGNRFLEELTLLDLNEFVTNYPEFRSFLSTVVEFPE